MPHLLGEPFFQVVLTFWPEAPRIAGSLATMLRTNIRFRTFTIKKPPIHPKADDGHTGDQAMTTNDNRDPKHITSPDTTAATSTDTGLAKARDMGTGTAGGFNAALGTGTGWQRRGTDPALPAASRDPDVTLRTGMPTPPTQDDDILSAAELLQVLGPETPPTPEPEEPTTAPVFETVEVDLDLDPDEWRAIWGEQEINQEADGKLSSTQGELNTADQWGIPIDEKPLVARQTEFSVDTAFEIPEELEPPIIEIPLVALNARVDNTPAQNKITPFLRSFELDNSEAREAMVRDMLAAGWSMADVEAWRCGDFMGYIPKPRVGSKVGTLTETEKVVSDGKKIAVKIPTTKMTEEEFAKLRALDEWTPPVPSEQATDNSQPIPSTTEHPIGMADRMKEADSAVDMQVTNNTATPTVPATPTTPQVASNAHQADRKTTPMRAVSVPWDKWGERVIGALAAIMLCIGALGLAWYFYHATHNTERAVERAAEPFARLANAPHDVKNTVWAARQTVDSTVVESAPEVSTTYTPSGNDDNFAITGEPPAPHNTSADEPTGRITIDIPSSVPPAIEEPSSHASSTPSPVPTTREHVSTKPEPSRGEVEPPIVKKQKITHKTPSTKQASSIRPRQPLAHHASGPAKAKNSKAFKVVDHIINSIAPPEIVPMDSVPTRRFDRNPTWLRKCSQVWMRGMTDPHETGHPHGPLYQRERLDGIVLNI